LHGLRSPVWLRYTRRGLEDTLGRAESSTNRQRGVGSSRAGRTCADGPIRSALQKSRVFIRAPLADVRGGNEGGSKGVQTITDEQRGVRAGDPGCTHNYPIMVTKTETGCYARCLKCLAEGPERPFSEAARLTLLSGEKKGSATALLSRRG
jgi:hypothetical protein